MTRDDAVALATAYYDSGSFLRDLSRRVAIRSESQNPERSADVERYLKDELGGALDALGFTRRIVTEPRSGRPFLIAERLESPAAVTVLSYAHGDVITGQDAKWRSGLSPWTVTVEGDRLYGRGTADNKGQHTVNLGALAAVLESRGRLCFNLRLLIEAGEELGSPGLREICAAERDALRADLFLASDGPRWRADKPTIFLGSRGVMNFDLTVDLRDGAHHSGNWGGLLADPGIILAHAIAAIASAKGVIQIAEWLPAGIPEPVRDALRGLEIEPSPGDPAIDPDWGDSRLSLPEKVLAWTSFDVLAFTTGNPERPVNAIPPTASAHCSIRYVAGADIGSFLPALERHLARNGLGQVKITPSRSQATMAATRLDPADPWVGWTKASIARTTGAPPVVLPNLGGTLPNDIFADLLGLPTIWVPHSYAACAQHAPNEHMLGSVARDGLRIMAGLWWDLGEPGTPRH